MYGFVTSFYIANQGLAAKVKIMLSKVLVLRNKCGNVTSGIYTKFAAELTEELFSVY
jgi:hypothetical protein